MVFTGGLGRTGVTELFTVCIDLNGGNVVHDIKVFDNPSPQRAHEGYNTHATPTPLIEGSRIYVSFGAYGTACLDTQTGKKLWDRRDLKCDHRVRPGSSPSLDEKRLFLVFDATDTQFIVALDRTSGDTLWRREQHSGVDFETTLKAAGIADTKATAKKKPGDNRKAFATPAIIEHAGKKQLVSPATEVTISCDPATGAELWRVRHDGLGWNSACRPIHENVLVYVITGFAKQLLAIRSSARRATSLSLRRHGTSAFWPTTDDYLMCTKKGRTGEANNPLHTEPRAARLLKSILMGWNLLGGLGR